MFFKFFSVNRQKHIKLKTVKGRKLSSTNWLSCQLNDKYTQLAKEEGYRSRSAYKLLDIDKKFSILKGKKVVIDLGSSPGGWSQVVAQHCNHVISVDMLFMEEIPGVRFLQCDFTKCNDLIEGELLKKSPDLILSDMSPAICGHPEIDHIRIVLLCEEVLKFAVKILKKGGMLVIKAFQGSEDVRLYSEFKRVFKIVKYYKPDATRNKSSEYYLIALDFLLN